MPLNRTVYMATASVAILFAMACAAPPRTSSPSIPEGTHTEPLATTSYRPPVDNDPQPDLSFVDGTWEVNKDIQPGTYKSAVPADSVACYWERLKGFGGDFTDIIANGTGDPGRQVQVTIKKTDKGFRSDGCGTWTRRK